MTSPQEQQQHSQRLCRRWQLREADDDDVISASTLPWWKLQLVCPAYRARLTHYATCTYRREQRILHDHPEDITSAAGKQGGCVMAQYVRLPRNNNKKTTKQQTQPQREHDNGSSDSDAEDDRNAMLAHRHPSSIIACSSLASLRAAALCALAPVDSVKARAQQEREVDAQLRAGRMAVRAAAASAVATTKTTLPTTTAAAVAQSSAHMSPLLPPQPPASPRSVHRGMRIRFYHSTNAHNAARPRTPSSSPLDDSLGEYHSDILAQATQQQQQQQQQKAAAAASSNNKDVAVRVGCVDHVYGLSYYWNRPLPPPGYIRVTPDPQYAMWPDDDDDDSDDDGEEEDDKGCCRRSDSAAAGVLSSSSLQRVQHGGARHRRCRRRHRDNMARLADEVNRRNAFLRMLREHGCTVPLHLLRMPDNWQPRHCLTTTTTSSSSAALRDVHGNAHTAVRHATTTTAARLQRVQPCYDGVEYINVVTTLPAKATHNKSTAHATRTTTAAAATASTSNNASSSVVVGVYRQSQWLLLYKLYCYALHSEARERRVRRQGRRRRTVTAQQQHRHDASNDDNNTDNNSDNNNDGDKENSDEDKDDESDVLLRDVPHVCLPVMRVQRCSPPLQLREERHTPVLDKVRGAAHWVGLCATPHAPLGDDDTDKSTEDTTAAAAAAAAVWHHLYAVSLRTRQALRDVFACLPHDRDGRVHKVAYVSFVRRLLQLFFPLHLRGVHDDVAAEAWVYRGCVEDVCFDTFYAAMFAVPFIFLRDVARVSEDDYVEFWLLVRVCLYTTTTTRTTAAADVWQLRGFTHAQLAQLQRCALVTDDDGEEEVIVERSHDADVQQQQQQSRIALLDEEQERREALLARSRYYTQQRRRLHTRHCDALSAIAAATSSWSVHAHDVYLCGNDGDDTNNNGSNIDDTHDGHDDKTSTTAAAAAALDALDVHTRSRSNTTLHNHRDKNDDDDDDAMLQYLADVADDVFDTRVSLRERYRVHCDYARLRAQYNNNNNSNNKAGGAVAAVGSTTTTTLPPVVAATTTTQPPLLSIARSRHDDSDDDDEVDNTAPQTTRATQQQGSDRAQRDRAAATARLRARRRREQQFLSQRKTLREACVHVTSM